MEENGFSPALMMIILAVLITAGVGGYIAWRTGEMPSVQTPSVGHSEIISPSSSLALPGVEKCVVGGCNEELCQSADAPPAVSICIYKKEFTCYKRAKCEVQQNGVCGWTQTHEFTACIKSARETPIPTPVFSICDPPIECAAPPRGCSYQAGDKCVCGQLVCATPSPILSPLSPPILSPTVSVSASPVQTPSMVSIAVEADDLGFYPQGALSFASGTRVTLTFAVRTDRVYYGGLDFRSSHFASVNALPGKTATVEFIADSSFIITSYWPSSGVYKASLSVNIE